MAEGRKEVTPEDIAALVKEVRSLKAAQNKKSANPWTRFKEWRAGTCWDEIIFTVLITLTLHHYAIQKGIWIFNRTCSGG